MLLTKTNNENPPPYEGGVDHNPRQPDYDRGWLTRVGDNPHSTVTKKKLRDWQQQRSPQSDLGNYYERIKSQQTQKTTTQNHNKPQQIPTIMTIQDEPKNKNYSIGNISQQFGKQNHENHNISQQTVNLPYES